MTASQVCAEGRTEPSTPTAPDVISALGADTSADTSAFLIPDPWVMNVIASNSVRVAAELAG